MMNRNSKRLPTLLVMVLLWGTRWQVPAQRTLNPSEELSWHFAMPSDWLDVGPTFAVPPGGANGHFTATLETNLPPGTVLRCELYEGLFFDAPTDGLPLATFFYTSAPPNTITGLVAGAWQDREGTIRFTALTGPATIKLIDLEVDTPSLHFKQWDYHYLLFVPPVAPPRLSISYSSNSVRLSWWTNVSPGYVLESANAVAGGAWLAVNVSPAISNAQKLVTLSTTGTATGYFRLRK